MAFTEKDAIEEIKTLMSFNDTNKTRQVLYQINPNIFKNKDIQSKFKEVLASLSNNDNINYLRGLLNKFVEEYNKGNEEYHFWFCSEQLRNKFVRENFSPIEIKKFREVIEKITTLKNNYPTETIGEFFISPRGNNPIRIAWFIKGNKIYFCESFNHHNEYDKFCDAARNHRIKRENYGGWDYIEDFSPLKLRAA
jgi:hypothetical protein